jgi:hypothetical protein
MGSTSKKTTRPKTSAPRRAHRDSSPAVADKANGAAQTGAPADTAPAIAAAPAATTTVSSAPSDADIARLAYRYFVESGFVHGNALAHWLRAEDELGARK